MRVKILNLDKMPDSMGEIIDPPGVTVREGEVPVVYDYSDDITKLMGYATLEVAVDGVYANIRHREGAAHTLLGLYPGAGGVTTERVGNIIKKCEIRMVGVHMGRNADYRIKTIGVQLEEA